MPATRSRFSDGFAAVWVQSKWGYVDQKGDIVIKPQFDRAGDFSNGAAVVYANGARNRIDKQGRRLGPWCQPLSSRNRLINDEEELPGGIERVHIGGSFEVTRDGFAFWQGGVWHYADAEGRLIFRVRGDDADGPPYGKETGRPPGVEFPLGSSDTKPQTPTLTPHPFTARVKGLSMVPARHTICAYPWTAFTNRQNGGTFVAGVDARWAVDLEVTATGKGDSLLKKGERITFIIHSPSRDLLCAPDDALGRELHLSLVVMRRTADTVSFSISPWFDHQQTGETLGDINPVGPRPAGEPAKDEQQRRSRSGQLRSHESRPVSSAAQPDRFQFHGKLAQVRDGDKEDVVRSLLGPPTDIRRAPDAVPYPTDEIWCYGTDGHGSLATLGEVCFRKRSVVWVAGGRGEPPPSSVIRESDLRAGLRSLDPGPECAGHNDPLHLIRVTNYLQPLGKEKALAIIGENGRIHDAGVDETWLFLLLRTLFDISRTVGHMPDMLVGAMSPGCQRLRQGTPRQSSGVRCVFSRDAAAFLYYGGGQQRVGVGAEHAPLSNPAGLRQSPALAQLARWVATSPDGCQPPAQPSRPLPSVSFHERL